MSNRITDLSNEFTDYDVETYKLLENSQNQGKILTAKVIACIPNEGEKRPDYKWFIVGTFRDWRVLIPCFNMGLPIAIDEMKDKAGNPLSPHDKERFYKANMTKMIGAEIDFVVPSDPRCISSATKQVVGDRAKAMEKKRMSNYFKQDKNGKSKVQRAFEANQSLEARVISVATSVVWVEVYGYLLKVFARDVSWRYTENLNDVVSVGDNIRVKFKTLDIDYENKEVLEAEVSIKDAYPNMQAQNMKNYRLDSIIAGKITGTISGGYFVQIGDLNNGIDVFCKKVNCIDIPHKGDIVSVKLGLFDEEKARVFGSIMAVIEKKNKNYVA